MCCLNRYKSIHLIIYAEYLTGCSKQVYETCTRKSKSVLSTLTIIFFILDMVEIKMFNDEKASEY